jgi:hypothetical protein
MTLLIDRIFQLFKWPVAILSLGNLWFLILKDVELILKTLNGTHQNFWLGMVVYLLIYRFFFSARLFGSWLPTLIHECIHVLFAWLTLHRVTGFSVSWRKGGHVEYVGGEGNWLITISPYFFPLATILGILIEGTLQPTVVQRSLGMGALFGFELIYVWRQIHPQQTDFHNVGMLFVWMFLPGAVLFGYGILLSFLLLGVDGASAFLGQTMNHTVALGQWALEYIQSLLVPLQ